MYLISFDVFVRMNDSCIMINPLVTSFTSESGLGSESGLSCVIRPGTIETYIRLSYLD